MSTADLAIATFGVTELATTGALVYVVRRVTPWPKPPATGQSQASVRKTADSAVPSGSTT